MHLVQMSDAQQMLFLQDCAMESGAGLGSGTLSSRVGPVMITHIMQ